MATYFGSRPAESGWTANGSAESGHDFLNQINESKGKQAQIEQRAADQRAKEANAYQQYQDALTGQRDYGDIYSGAKATEGVDEAKQQYQKSLASVNATQSAMNTLPSSINAGSNVVLNASQRNAALGNQMSKYQNTLDYQTRQNAGDLSQYQTALGAAQNLAGNEMSQEQTKVAQTMQGYQDQMNQINQIYNELQQERQLMRSIYGDMYEDEYRHMQRELEIWADNLSAETQRYEQDQETARNNAKIAAQNYATSVQKYMVDSQNMRNAPQLPQLTNVGRTTNAITNRGEVIDEYGNPYTVSPSGRDRAMSLVQAINNEFLGKGGGKVYNTYTVGMGDSNIRYK